jgi:hypothetical protein
MFQAVLFYKLLFCIYNAFHILKTQRPNWTTILLYLPLRLKWTLHYSVETLILCSKLALLDNSSQTTSLYYGIK